MRVTGRRSRDEVLVDVAALASPLIEILGADMALAIDDAVVVDAGERWP